MRILLTGGAGFIGSHIASAYHKLGHEVIIVDNLSSGSMGNISHLLNQERFYFYEVDITNKPSLEKVFAEHRPQLINHHAAQKSVPYSIEDPLTDAHINIMGLLNLLILAKKYPIENFIYVSSGGALATEIVGDMKSSEVDPPQLESPYAITKHAGEQYVRVYANLFNFNYTGLRYGNVYGPGQIADGECGVIPIFVNNSMANKKSILMTYDDMPRGCTRDYVFVSDVVDINVLLVEKSLNCVINISSSEEMPILDIYNMIQEAFQTNAPIEITGPRLGDVRRSVLDSSLAQKLTEWKPKVMLKDGLNILSEKMKINT